MSFFSSTTVYFPGAILRLPPQAAQGAAHGNSHEKLWSKAVTYLELALPGVR